MGFIEDIKAGASKARDAIATEVGRYKNKPFMLAIAAGGALMAAADGTISGPEKAKMAKFIQMSPELKVFDSGEVIREFTGYAEKIEFDADFGTAECLKVISRIKGDAEQSRTLLRVVCALGAADGNFDADEKKVARKMCGELGLDPVEFEVQAEV